MKEQHVSVYCLLCDFRVQIEMPLKQQLRKGEGKARPSGKGKSPPDRMVQRQPLDNWMNEI